MSRSRQRVSMAANPDDHPDAVNNRLDLYESQTAPLIEHYTKHDRVSIVDGFGSPDEVSRRLTDAVNSSPG